MRSSRELEPPPPPPSQEALDEDVVDTGEIVDMAEDPASSQQSALSNVTIPSRPLLQRNSMQAVPAPSAPPVPEPPPSNHSLSDSLSLLQLRQIVQQVNRSDPVAYDFVYADMGQHAEEIDEWFVCHFWQWVRLNSAQKAFEWHWEQEMGDQKKKKKMMRMMTWDDADDETRARFMTAAIAGVQSNDAALRSASVGRLVYLVLGRWGDTAVASAAEPGSRTVASTPQLQAIKAGVESLSGLGGLQVVWQALKDCFEAQWALDIQDGSSQETEDELISLMTIMYICVQETLHDRENMQLVHEKLVQLNPSLVDFMLVAITKLRWDEQNAMPHTQIFLLFWKSILLTFGGIQDLHRVKKATQETSTSGKTEKESITASPLDYHAFRQEITSKYPAYVPPQAKLPIEIENNTYLPLIPSQSARNHGSNGVLTEHAQNGGASILNQPVHIATPAPSPPPSPGIGGKGGKKQNYQTNQHFPFMYPPLDATSNSAGGKGLAGVHDATVGRKWEGSEIPASILEAGELFSTRVRMTRATRQLWEEREEFLKFQRGWDEEDTDDELENLDLDELSLEEKEILQGLKEDDRKGKPKPMRQDDIDLGPRPEQLSEQDRQRLIAVEKFYKEALPHLQSLVIVLLRPILANVTAVVAAQPPQAGPGMPGRPQNAGSNQAPNGVPAGPRPGPDGNGPNGTTSAPEMTLEETDAARTREITSKAMGGILLLLLKWFRLSHVLKFEYFTQLLLDSNYVPLVLKLFAHQDIQQVVDSKIDRAENSFFQFCNLRSAAQASTEAGEGQDSAKQAHLDEDDSEDDAAPPPIKRDRIRPPPSRDNRSNKSDSDSDDDDLPEPRLTNTAPDGSPSTPARPEVDELGYPVGALPAEPITDFSWRNFFSLINYLRVMQKICKGKAHRNLLLVQYKSSTILRKSLRVPQPELRLYTLKLFKNQVPYCGRKWRQSNMRVITAVYLHCRPELRDEWLAGSDVDAEVDAALPLEQAMRSLTQWLNARRYPDAMALELRSALKEEQSFFARELEKLDAHWIDAEEGMSEMEHYEGWT